MKLTILVGACIMEKAPTSSKTSLKVPLVECVTKLMMESSKIRDGLDSSKLILASASPRRRELLAKAGYVFTVQPPSLDEPNHLPMGLPPVAYAESLAYFKARSVAETNPAACVLGADTVVALHDNILGKPIDADDARKMLKELSHNRHAVITGVALVGPGERRIIAADVTYVTMRPMSEQEIEDYIASGEWEGKAGAYAIQETADRFIVKLEGSFSNVVGLPMELLARLLHREVEARS